MIYYRDFAAFEEWLRCEIYSAPGYLCMIKPWLEWLGKEPPSYDNSRRYLCSLRHQGKTLGHVASVRVALDKFIMWQALNNEESGPVCDLCGRSDCVLVFHHWDGSSPEKGIHLCYRCHRFAEGIDRGVSVAMDIALKKHMYLVLKKYRYLALKEQQEIMAKNEIS